MVPSKLIQFNFTLLTLCVVIFAYPVDNIVDPDYNFNSSGDGRISRKERRVDWLVFGFCNSGMPLLRNRFCNGKKECLDGSDETMERCNNHSCDGSMFRCNYGGCVARTAVCDGVYQCADGSDEIQSVCRQVNCIVPYPTNNTVYFVSGCNECQSGLPTKEGSILRHQCLSRGFSKAVTSDIICRNGLWTPGVPACQSTSVEDGTCSNAIQSNNLIGGFPTTPMIPLSSTVVSTTTPSTTTPSTAMPSTTVGNITAPSTSATNITSTSEKSP